MKTTMVTYPPAFWSVGFKQYSLSWLFNTWMRTQTLTIQRVYSHLGSFVRYCFTYSYWETSGSVSLCSNTSSCTLMSSGIKMGIVLICRALWLLSCNLLLLWALSSLISYLLSIKTLQRMFWWTLYSLKSSVRLEWFITQVYRRNHSRKHYSKIIGLKSLTLPSQLETQVKYHCGLSARYTK